MGVFCTPCRVEGNALSFADGAAEVLQVQVQILHCLLPMTLQWHHNGCDGVSNHQPHDCLLNRLFRCRSKKTSKLRITGLCAGNSPVTGEFPAQMASDVENVSIWWRHHDKAYIEVYAIKRPWQQGSCNGASMRPIWGRQGNTHTYTRTHTKT